MFLEAADDFEGLTPDRSTWSEEALQGNPPRLVRYRRLRALERAFDVRPGFEALLDGSFLDHRPPHPELAEARWVYERLKDYLCAAWRVLDFNGGMLEASGEFCRAVELTEAVNDRFRGALAPIEAVVDAIVSPDGRAASLDELRSQGWPEDDLWEVDADWM